MPSVSQFLFQGTGRLQFGPHPERARADAELLLMHVLRTGRAWLIAHSEIEIGSDQGDLYFAMLQRRRNGEPIQHITGEQEFYGLPFRVTPDVLIPRPETEHLVEKALELAGSRRNQEEHPAGAKTPLSSEPLSARLKSCPVTEPSNSAGRLRSRGITESSNFGAEANSLESSIAPAESPRIVDVGTGSGAIAVALAFHLPNAQISALDISSAALEIARENALRNVVADRIRFLQSDLLSAVAHERFDIVVSNPPYVPTTDRDSLSVEVREHEPALALFAGEEGLDVYRRLIPAAFEALQPGGFLLMEIGYGQSTALSTLLKEAQFSQINFVPDLQSIPRVACAQRPA